MRLSEWIPAVPTAELDISVAPLVLQRVALLADSSFLSIAAGDTAGAAERLRVLGQVTAEIGALADRVAGMGMLYCKDGRPSLDGSCLKIPPCTT
jgi:hypothetical protein